MKSLAKGFTLIEVLVAVSLAAVLAALAFQGFSVASDSSEQVKEVTTRIDNIDRTFETLARDLNHLVVRSDGNDNGLPTAALVAEPVEGFFLQLTRQGKPNPLNLMRSDLSRVRYRWDDGTVYRLSRQLYSLNEDVPELILLEGVTRLVVELLVSDATSVEAGPWTPVWPPANSSEEKLPAAIRITLEVENFGEVSRMFELPVQPVSSTPT